MHDEGEFDGGVFGEKGINFLILCLGIQESNSIKQFESGSCGGSVSTCIVEALLDGEQVHGKLKPQEEINFVQYILCE